MQGWTSVEAWCGGPKRLSALSVTEGRTWYNLPPNLALGYARQSVIWCHNLYMIQTWPGNALIMFKLFPRPNDGLPGQTQRQAWWQGFQVRLGRTFKTFRQGWHTFPQGLHKDIRRLQLRGQTFYIWVLLLMYGAVNWRLAVSVCLCILVKMNANTGGTF